MTCTCVPREKKKKTNKKSMYDYLYTCFQSQKKKKYKKHMYNCLYMCFRIWGAGKG
jgi:hypothetical protein